MTSCDNYLDKHRIRVSLSGFGSDHYEQTHTGGNWKRVHRNLTLLAEYIQKYETGTIVEVYYHVNSINLSDAESARALCEELGLRFHPSISMLFHDYAMDFLLGNTLPANAQQAKAIMTISLEEMIDNAKMQKDKHCLLRRVVPVINWDLTVLPCCNYSTNKIAGALIANNYLETPLEDILKMREMNPLCIKCQELALHRYFNPVYYSDYINALISKDLENNAQAR